MAKAKQAKGKKASGEDDRSKTIAIRAYEIWESEGRQHGLSETYWLRAEKELGYDAAASMMGNKPEGADASRDDRGRDDGGRKAGGRKDGRASADDGTQLKAGLE